MAQIIAHGDWGGVVSHGTDAGLMVQFFNEAVYMEGKSAAEGKPIYENQDFVHIVTAGGKSDIKRRVIMEDGPNQPSDPERFPKQWSAYKRQTEQAQEGIPLETVGFLPKAEVLMFKASNVHTVEQLANIPDSAQHNFSMGFRRYRDTAIQYLKNVEGNKDTVALTAKLEAQQAKIELLEKMMAEQKNATPELALTKGK